MVPRTEHDRRLTPEQHRRKQQILTRSRSRRGRPGRTLAPSLKLDDMFLLTNAGGDIPWELPHAFGL